jgi:hypothetical protein
MWVLPGQAARPYTAAVTRALVLAALLVAVPARAEMHGAVAVGSHSEAVKPEFGGYAGAELWPGGLWGARVDAYFLHWKQGVLLEASAMRLLGSSRPHLVIAGHFGGGWDTRARAVALSAGLWTTLGLRLGPLALGLDAAVHPEIARHHVGLLVTGVIALEAMF